MNIQLLGNLRKFLHQSFGGASVSLRMTEHESLTVAQVEPAMAELTRSGRRFQGGNQIIANGIAPVAAIPTTTATLALYNASQHTSLVLERLGFWLGSGTAAAGATLLTTISPERIATAPTAHATGYGAQNANGGARSSKAFWAAAVTLPGSPAWAQVTSSMQLAAADIGQGDLPIEIGGSIIVPPYHALGLAILSGAGTTPLYGISAMWSELELALE